MGGIIDMEYFGLFGILFLVYLYLKNKKRKKQELEELKASAQRMSAIAPEHTTLNDYLMKETE
jgi:hypothetical protein